MSTSVRVVGASLILVMLGIFAEIFAFAALTFVPQLNRFTYQAPTVTEDEFQTYLKERHPILGWPGSSWLEANADARGARLSPSNAELGNVSPCISVYGDSFAYGDEVEHSDAWPNVLAGELECRVDNYGVGGYGVDQALLRFEGHVTEGRPVGKTVILTVFPDNLNRNVNQWRYLLSRSAFGFKPVFHVRGNSVDLVPLFSGSFAEFNAVAADPNTHLKNEQYLPGASGFRRLERLRFPYSATLARIAFAKLGEIRSFDVGGNRSLSNYPSYYDNSDGPSDQKRAVMNHIVDRYTEICQANVLECHLVLIPSPEQVFQREKFGEHDLLDWLSSSASQISFIDATDAFRNVEDICSELTRPDNCSGHFSPSGNRRLAEFLLELIG